MTISPVTMSRPDGDDDDDDNDDGDGDVDGDSCYLKLILAQIKMVVLQAPEPFAVWLL